MKQSIRKKICRQCFLVLISAGMLTIVTLSECLGQELPPRPPTTPPGIPEPPPRPLTVTVNLSSNLSFGAFYQGNAGGSVYIYPDGSRSATGDIVLLGMGYSVSTALFDVTAYPGTLVSILPGTSVLTGTNGGSLTLKTGEPVTFNPVIINTMPPASTQVRVGGELIIGTPLANPPGDYSGTFDVTFVQE